MIDPVERVEILDPARIRDGDERVELPEVLDRKRDPQLVGERPEDVRRDRAAEVGVELGEPGVAHRASLLVPSAYKSLMSKMVADDGTMMS